MIIDCKSEEFRNRPVRARVFLNGEEIQAVWYVDTEKGLLKTYAVVEDAGIMGTHHLSPALKERGIREGWEMPIDGVVSKTLHGGIELRPFE